MKHYFARDVLSSGRNRIDVRHDTKEIVTFYPDTYEGNALWHAFIQKVKDDQDMLTMQDGAGGYRIA